MVEEKARLRADHESKSARPEFMGVGVGRFCATIAELRKAVQEGREMLELRQAEFIEKMGDLYPLDSVLYAKWHLILTDPKPGN